MKQIENHMVALPQPELDYEVKCNHRFTPHIEEILDYDECSIVFKVKCQECGVEGTAEGEIKLLHDVDWD